jgi:hypothetical protein
MRLLPLLLALLALIAAGAPLADAPFQAAYAEANITPPLGGSMPGYFQDRRATGVLDPLKAHVLMLRKGKERIAIVQCDLIGMGAREVERIREAVRERVKPAPTAVWVHCSHTHTGGFVPRGDQFTTDAETIFPGFYPGVVDENWVTQLVDRTADAVKTANADLADERDLTLHEGRETTVGHIRRYFMKDGSLRTNPGRNNPDVVRPAGEIDPRVTVLRFRTRKILAVIYGCHPDTVGGTQYSADYPAHLAAAVKERLGAEWRVIFLNACCGNINHIDLANPAQKGGPDEARRLGRLLADATLEALKKGEPLVVDDLEAAHTTVECRLRKPKPEEVAESERRLATGKDTMEFNGLFAPAVVVLAKTQDREHRAEISALRIGRFGLAGLPGEIFVELGREVEAASPFKPTRTIGLTNGAMGYIPTREGYAQGGYEAGYRSARYEPDNGHRWAAAAGKLLQGLSK